MKIRNGFVSNSSSSSFVCVGRKISTNFIKKFDEYVDTMGVLDVHKIFGTKEFGWDPEKYYDLGSKVLWAFYQSQYAEPKRNYNENSIYSNQYLSMLEKVLVKNIPSIKAFIWPSSWNDWNSEQHGYIDHESNASENQNMEIFDSDEILEKFLFSEDSYIQTDNDNY